MDWWVLYEVSLPDHRYLELTLIIAFEQSVIQNPRKMDWANFNDLLGNKLQIPMLLRAPFAIVPN